MVEIGPGTSIQSVAVNLCNQARRSGQTLEATFNAVDLVVTPATAPSDVLNYFWDQIEERERKQQKNALVQEEEAQ